jgi:hypothetical protein
MRKVSPIQASAILQSTNELKNKVSSLVTVNVGWGSEALFPGLQEKNRVAIIIGKSL